MDRHSGIKLCSSPNEDFRSSTYDWKFYPHFFVGNVGVVRDAGTTENTCVLFHNIQYITYGEHQCLQIYQRMVGSKRVGQLKIQI